MIYSSSIDSFLMSSEASGRNAVFLMQGDLVVKLIAVLTFLAILGLMIFRRRVPGRILLFISTGLFIGAYFLSSRLSELQLSLEVGIDGPLVVQFVFSLAVLFAILSFLRLTWWAVRQSNKSPTSDRHEPHT
ncbi:MAG: hypothetical protein AAGH76_08810 [Pseudomonadota bacterium]